MEMVNLTISPVMPDDLDRTFICKVTSPQVPPPHMSQTVRIIKKPGMFSTFVLFTTYAHKP